MPKGSYEWFRHDITAGAGRALWLPKDGSQEAGGGYTQYLPDIGMWVSSVDQFPALRSRLRSYPVEEFLALVSRVSWLRAGGGQDLVEAMRRRNWDPRLTLRDYQMAFLVRVLLEDYDWSGERRWPVDGADQEATLLYECTRMATHVLPSADRPLEQDRPADAHATLVRIANQQFGDFEPIRAFYPRAMLLLQECVGSPQRAMILDQVLRDITGLDLHEVLFLTFGLYTTFYEGKRGQLFEPDIMTNSPEFPGITRERMQRLLDWLSTDYEGFRRAGRLPEVGAQEGYELYNFNPLVKYPIIRTPSGLYVIPIARYLLRRVTTGLFYDLIGSKHRGKVGDIIGRAIEQYVARLITDLPSHGYLIPEVPYEPGKTTCEWLLDEPDAVVLVECKRGSLRQGAKTSGQREDVKRDMSRKGAVPDGIAKLWETAEAVRAGKIDGIDPGKRIVPLLITLDQFFFANTPYVRGIVEEVLKERGITLPGFPYQICPIPDFEHVCRLLNAAGQHLSTAIATKLDTADHAEWEFAQWVWKVWPKGKPGTIPSHDKVYDEDLAAMANSFRSPPRA